MLKIGKQIIHGPGDHQPHYSLSPRTRPLAFTFSVYGPLLADCSHPDQSSFPLISSALLCPLPGVPHPLCPHYLCVSSGLTPLTWTLQWAPDWPRCSRLMSVYCLWSLIRHPHIRRNSCVIIVCCLETQQRCLLGAGCHQTNRLYF